MYDTYDPQDVIGDLIFFAHSIVSIRKAFCSHGKLRFSVRPAVHCRDVSLVITTCFEDNPIDFISIIAGLWAVTGRRNIIAPSGYFRAGALLGCR